MSEQGSEPDWVSILSADCDAEFENVVITPERVSMISLIDCREQLDKSSIDKLRLALAAKVAHLALQAALTAAIAGTANIGAHPQKLRGQYLKYFEDSNSGTATRPDSDRVMSFVELLDAARTNTLPWTDTVLDVSDDEADLINRLTKVRHDVEHPKQLLYSIEPAYILRMLPIAARLTVTLLNSVFHHFEPGELEKIRIAVRAIEETCEATPAADAK